MAQMVVKPQGQIDQRRRFGNDFGAAAETGQIMAEVAVILLEGKVKSLPVKS
jgi:hypothetical protein